MSKISVVVPCYNEERELEQFYHKLINTLSRTSLEYEIIFVDDGSSDSTSEILFEISTKNKKAKVVTLSRNFGQQSALICGFSHAKGDCVLELDVKLDQPFEIIPKMIAKWEQGNEIVHAVNKSKRNPFKRFITKIYLKFLNFVSHISIPLDTDEFKLYDRKVIDEICSMKEQDKYIVALTSWVGFKQAKVEYTNSVQSKRKKNVFKKAMGVASAGIIGNSTWPLCLSFWAGTILNIISQIVLTVFTCLAMAKIYLSVSAWLIPIILFLFGLLFTVNSFSNIYLGKIYQEVKGRPDYIISKKLNFD